MAGTHLWIIAITSSLIHALLAQSPLPPAPLPCGTSSLPPHLLEALQNRPSDLFQHPERYLREGMATRWFPIQLLILCEDARQRKCTSLAGILDQICWSDTDQIRKINFRLILEPEYVHFISDSTAYAGDALSIAFQYYVTDRINIIYLGTTDHCGIPACGCLNCCGAGMVSISKPCVPYDHPFSQIGTVFSHELGHYWGLPHTFNQINCVECKDRTNCYECGDQFCDTEVDYFGFSWSCFSPPDTFEDSSCPPPIDTFQAPAGYIMSYGWSCADKFFTQEQSLYMHYLVQNDPFYAPVLRPSPPYFLGVPDSTELIFPARDSLSPTGSTICIRWRRTPNARFYAVSVMEEPVPLIPPFPEVWRTLTYDTFVWLPELDPGRKYQVWIRPLNAIEFCAPWTRLSFSTASSLQATAQVSREGCTWGAHVQIFASGGAPPYLYRWDTRPDSMTGWQLSPEFCYVPAGVHIFSIRDSLNQEVRVYVYVDTSDVALPSGIHPFSDASSFPWKLTVIPQEGVLRIQGIFPPEPFLHVSFFTVEGKILGSVPIHRREQSNTLVDVPLPPSVRSYLLRTPFTLLGVLIVSSSGTVISQIVPGFYASP